MTFAPGATVIAMFPTGDPEFPRVAVPCTVSDPAYAPSGKVRIAAPSGKVFTADAEKLATA